MAAASGRVERETSYGLDRASFGLVEPHPSEKKLQRWAYDWLPSKGVTWKLVIEGPQTLGDSAASDLCRAIAETAPLLLDFETRFGDDAACLDWLWRRVAPDGRRTLCRRCGVERRFHRVRDRRSFDCDHCGLHIHPTASTIFHGSRTPLRLWFKAIWLAAYTPRGIGARTLERELGVSSKAARQMLKKIRSELPQEASPRPRMHREEADVASPRRRRRKPDDQFAAFRSHLITPKEAGRREMQERRPSVNLRRRRCQAYLLWLVNAKDKSVQEAIDSFVELSTRDTRLYRKITGITQHWTMSKNTIRRYWSDIPLARRQYAGRTKPCKESWYDWLLYDLPSWQAHRVRELGAKAPYGIERISLQ
jgi:hypothetical protein